MFCIAQLARLLTCQVVQSGRDVHDSEDAIVSEIRILLQLSEWKYIVPLLLKALSIDLSGLLYVQEDWLRYFYSFLGISTILMLHEIHYHIELNLWERIVFGSF